MATYDNAGQQYPMTKMNFLVTVANVSGTGAFTEVTGMDASVDVIEFRQGNSGSMAKSKIPGLVKHGNVSLKMGYIAGNDIKTWAQACLSERKRKELVRHDVYIELIDPTTSDLSVKYETSPVTSDAQQWVLKNAFVASYKGADLDAKNSEVAIETLEIAYEELQFPGQSSAGVNAAAASTTTE